MPSVKQLGQGWYDQLHHCFEKPWWNSLHLKVKARLLVTIPEPGLIFRPFRETPFENLKAIILNTKPEENGEANGLAYGSLTRKSISLLAIDRSLHKTYNAISPDNTAEYWAAQGVLMLNVYPTTHSRSLMGHQHQEWLVFLMEVLQAAANKKDVVFISWGGFSQYYMQPFQAQTPMISSTHPSTNWTEDGNKGFDGKFEQINQLLIQLNQTPIQWTLPQSLSA